jgi:low affinity Fe/Cu permease
MRHASQAVARFAPGIVGSPTTFVLVLASTIVWLLLGPFLHFSNGWLLVPSALASIVALILVVLLQQSQNRDTRALQLKLDEVIRSVDQARTELVGLEARPDEELEEIAQEFVELRESQSKQ